MEPLGTGLEPTGRIGTSSPEAIADGSPVPAGVPTSVRSSGQARRSGARPTNAQDPLPER